MYLVVKCIGTSSFKRNSGKIIKLHDTYHGALNLYEDDIKFKSSLANFSNSTEIV